jgi:ATPase family AAA domain-containing protein 3A/B
MDYAIMSGGDVGALGQDSITQLNALFQWARRSPNGLLLFIDEAESFLSSRSTVDVGVQSTSAQNGSSNRRQRDSNVSDAMNALLYQTGEASLMCSLLSWSSTHLVSLT